MIKLYNGVQFCYFVSLSGGDLRAPCNGNRANAMSKSLNELKRGSEPMSFETIEHIDYIRAGTVGSLWSVALFTNMVYFNPSMDK